MNKDQILAQIRNVLASHQAQELSATLTIYFVESMIVGPGDFRHVVTQTTTLSPGASFGTTNQYVSSDSRTSGEGQTMDVQEDTQAGGMMEVGELAGSAVALVAPYLAEGGKELAKKVGGEAGERIVKLYDKVKAKLTGGGAEALADLEKQPKDADTQAALRVQLKKALEADPAFRAELEALVEEIKGKGGERIIQSANVTGDRNVTMQIAGSGNVVR